MEEQLGKFFSGEATEREVEEILRWRSESAENAEVFFSTKMLWTGSENLKEGKAPNAVLDTILQEPGAEIGIWRYLPYAAVIALLLGFGWWFFLRPTADVLSDDLLPMVEIHQLEDGSQLTLYRGSSFSIEEMSEERRVVNLTGKGFFDVARDESRPFTVLAADARIEVLGTSFVIDAYTPDRTKVFVASGVVSMSTNTAVTDVVETTVLEEGDKGVLRAGEAVVKKQPIDDQNFMAWSSGILSFDEDELSEVGEVLNEVYGLSFSFKNEQAANCQLTAKFRRKSGEQVVRLIADTFDMTYKITGDKVEFSGKGCE